MSDYWAIIPATGIGSRMEHNIPKQYIKLHNGLTILDQTIKKILSIKKIKGLVVAINVTDNYFKKSIFFNNKKILKTVIGGAHRYISVLNAVNELVSYAKDDDFVLVHDSVRPCVNIKDVKTLINSLKNDSVGGLLATPIVETVKKVTTDSFQTINRNNLWIAQTPQMYRYNLLREVLTNAYKNNINITDETQAFEIYGLVPKIIKGNKNNIKITHPNDLQLANFLLNEN